MIYKVYKIRFKSPDEAYAENFKEFNKLYTKYDVDVKLGGVNAKDPNEVYYITVYKDENHYEETVKKLQSDSTYAELTVKLEDTRESIDVITLNNVID
ncbi:MAG: hypothetical protein FK733_17435 [Asgard group archaeon]|nr:hypothetical protein [Asgard group archaeon]